MQHVIVLDEGTTSTRAVLFDETSRVVDEESRHLALHAPSATTVEQDAAEIASSSIEALRAVLERARGAGREVRAVAIANQRTTTVLWDRFTGQPVAPVVSWQDSRAQRLVDELGPEWAERHAERTGLPLSAANLALHLAMRLEDPEIRRRAEAGELLAGTPDTWLVWSLTGGPAGGRHVTSASNAGSAGPFDLHASRWWSDLLDHLDVPGSLLAEVLDDDADFGETSESVAGARLPIRAMFADQQAALFGHGGFEAGALKCTHGTGSFIDFNIGEDLVIIGSGLDTRIAWRTSDGIRYMCEGSSYVTGSAIDWLVDGIHVLPSAADLDAVYARTPDSSGVICVPALAGFTAPHWDRSARGLVLGLHRGVTSDHLVRATVDGIARTAGDLVAFMGERAGIRADVVLADGGLSRSDALLQAQADATGATVVRAADAAYVTARGAAWMGGIAAGVWPDRETALAGIVEAETFAPRLGADELAETKAAWEDAIHRALGWRPQPTVRTTEENSDADHT